jgi:hypothetical protein
MPKFRRGIEICGLGEGITEPSRSAILSVLNSTLVSLGGHVEYLAERADTGPRKAPLADPAPSLAFLNSCLNAYFRHFNAIFPFIHQPTFAASRASPLLLTVVCYTGALYLGTKNSRDFSFSLGKRVHALMLMQLFPVVRFPG